MSLTRRMSFQSLQLAFLASTKGRCRFEPRCQAQSKSTGIDRNSALLHCIEHNHVNRHLRVTLIVGTGPCRLMKKIGKRMGTICRHLGFLSIRQQIEDHVNVAVGATVCRDSCDPA